MGKSIVGLVNTWDEAEKVKQALIGQGFRRDEINSGFDNPDGQQGKYPIGGDEYADPGARKGGKGAGTGMIIGAIIGAIAGFSVSLIPGFLDSIPAIGLILGALGAGIGAYTGSMAGGVKKMGDDEKGTADLKKNPASTGEVFIAVNARDNQAEQSAMRILRENGARDVKQHSRDFFQDVKAQGSKANEKLVK